MTTQVSAKWTPILPSEGGTVLDLCGVALGAGSVTILALTTTGVFHSVDNAKSWSPVSDSTQPPLPTSMAVGGDPDEDLAAILVGSSIGLFHFEADPKRWVQILAGEAVTAIGLSRCAPMEAPIFVATENSGLLVSDGSGSCWRDSNVGLDGEPIIGVAVSPQYHVDHTAFLAITTGLFRSRNGGKAWRRLDFEAGPGTIQCLDIVSGVTMEQTLYVGLSNGLWASNDMGHTWNQTPEFAGLSVWNISVTPRFPDENFISILSNVGCFTTDDRCNGWHFSPTADHEVVSSSLIPSPSGSMCIIGTARNGICRRSIADDNWVTCNAGLEAVHRTQIHAVKPIVGDIHHIVANEVLTGLLVSHNGGETWSIMNRDAQSDLDVPVIQASAQRDTVLTLSGADMRKHQVSEGTWERIVPLPLGHKPAGFTSLGQVLPGNLMAISTDGTVWHFDSDSGWTDRGQPFGLDIAASVEFVESSQVATGLWAVIYAQEHPSSAPIPALWRSDDSGTTWNQWLESSSPVALTVTGVQEHGQEVALIGTANQVYKVPITVIDQPLKLTLDDLNPRFLDDVQFITSILPSPRFIEDQTLFVGTDRGVLISTDAGATYRQWSFGRPHNITGLAPMTAGKNLLSVIALELGGTVWARPI